MEVVASLSQGRTAAAQCGLFTYKSVPVIFEPPCTYVYIHTSHTRHIMSDIQSNIGTTIQQLTYTLAIPDVSLGFSQASYDKYAYL